MPKEIPIDHPSLDLIETLEYVFSSLEKGVNKNKHDFHLLVLATIDENNEPQNRNVVIRKVDMLNALIRFHTDKRSNKINDIKHNKSISLLGYDKVDKFQIRLTAEAKIEDSEKVLSEIWSKMRPMSKECYRVSDKPGKIIDSRKDVIFQSEGAQDLNGFENFSIINCHINSIETLFLHSAGHIRAKYINKNNKFYGNWLIP
tara:strand:- start:623 stop:1228 length:606 start_codon:yes stop_codon:yes gene_type:complete